MDAPPADATADAPPVDAPSVDAGSGCIAEQFELSTDSLGRTRPIAIAPDGDGFVVVWSEWDDGEQLRIAHVPTTGSPGEPVLLGTEGAPGANDRTPELASGMLTFTSDLTTLAVPEVMAQPLDAAFAPVGAAVRVTNDDLAQRAHAIVATGAGFLLLYAETGATETRVLAQQLQTTGALEGAPQVIGTTTDSIDRLSAAPLGPDVGVTWVDQRRDGGDVWVRHLAATGAPLGDAIMVSTEGNASGGVRMASDEIAGVVVFDVMVGGLRPEIRSRLLNLDATPLTFEQIVSFAPAQGTGASLAAFAGGFASTYHSTEDRETTARVSFIHGSTGVVDSTVVLGATGSTHGRTAAAVASDGTLLVAWSDVRDGEGTKIMLSRLVCPDAWLRCSR